MRWVVNATPRPLWPRERFDTHCIGGWEGPRAGLDGYGKSRHPPGFDPRAVQPAASRCTDCAVPAHDQDKCCYDVFTAPLVPIPPSFVMSNIECPVWNVSPFVKKTGDLKASSSKISFRTKKHLRTAYLPIYSGVCYKEHRCYNERGGILSADVARACAWRVGISRFDLSVCHHLSYRL